MSQEEIFGYLVKIMAMFLILPVHEAAHAFAAYKLGDDTASRKGRLTLNPIAHLDPIGCLLMIFCGFGWAKPVPVNPSRFDRKYSIRKGMAITAFAGPLSNFIMAILLMIVYRFFLLSDVFFDAWYLYSTEGEYSTYYYIFLLLQQFIIINIGLGLFNLIPIPPLDGHSVLSYFSDKANNFYAKYSRYSNIILIVLMTTKILRTPLSFLAQKCWEGMYYLTNWIPYLFDKG